MFRPSVYQNRELFKYNPFIYDGEQSENSNVHPNLEKQDFTFFI